MTGKDFYETIKVDGDTVIGGMSYKKIVDVATGNYRYGMREDGRKVYCIYANYESNGEKLIYDFGLNVGDTFKLYDADETVDPASRATVVSVDTIVVGNRAFRVMDVRPNDQSGSSNWWVEGIGGMHGIASNSLLPGNNYTFSYCQINGETILTHKDVRSVRPYTGNVSNTGCMNKTRGESELGNMLIKLTREGRNLIGEVTNYLVNCAYDDVRVSCEQKGQNLYIYVSEIASEYADCMCPINIYFTIFNASKSQYGLYLNGQSLGQVSFADHSVVQIDSETLSQAYEEGFDFPVKVKRLEVYEKTQGVKPGEGPRLSTEFYDFLWEQHVGYNNYRLPKEYTYLNAEARLDADSTLVLDIITDGATTEGSERMAGMIIVLSNVDSPLTRISLNHKVVTINEEGMKVTEDLTLYEGDINPYGQEVIALKELSEYRKQIGYHGEQIYFDIEKIDHTVGVPPVLKTPPSAPKVLVNGNVLEFQGEHPAYTLNIVDNEGNTLFTTEVPESMMQVELPFNLTKDMEVNLLQGSWRIYGRLDPDHETVKVNGINNHPASPSAPVYDLQGRRIQGEPQKGVYLRNGRKYVRK